MVTDSSLTGSLTALLYYRFQVLCSHVGGNIIIIVLEHLFCQPVKTLVSNKYHTEAPALIVPAQ